MGYGDWIPLSTMGKIVVFILALLGLAVVSLLVMAINIKLNMKPNDHKAYVVLTKFALSKQIKTTAALVIYKFFKVVYYKKKGVLEDHSRLIMQLKTLCEDLQRYRRTYRSRKNPNISEDMLRCFEDFKQAQNSARFSLSLAGKMISNDLVGVSRSNIELDIIGDILKLPLDSEEYKCFQRDLHRRKTTIKDEKTEEEDTLRRDKTKLLLFKGIDEKNTLDKKPQTYYNYEDSVSEDKRVHSIRGSLTFKQKL